MLLSRVKFNSAPEKTAVTRKGCCKEDCKRLNVEGEVPHTAVCAVTFMLPHFVIILPVLCFFFLILYFLVCHQRNCRGLFFPPALKQMATTLLSGSTGLNTESKNGRSELEEGISSCRILFQERRVGYSYWAYT